MHRQKLMEENRNYLQRQMQDHRRQYAHDHIDDHLKKMVSAGGRIGVLPGMGVSYERQKQLKMVDRTVNRQPDQFVDHPQMEIGKMMLSQGSFASQGPSRSMDPRNY